MFLDLAFFPSRLGVIGFAWLLLFVFWACGCGVVSVISLCLTFLFGGVLPSPWCSFRCGPVLVWFLAGLSSGYGLVGLLLFFSYMLWAFLVISVWCGLREWVPRLVVSGVLRGRALASLFGLAYVCCLCRC